MYCTPCESFWTESQLVDGKCPDCGREVKPAKEEAYFFKMSKYADRLIDYINTHPEFIQPVSRKNEMMNNFLLPGLQDLVYQEHLLNGEYLWILMTDTLYMYGLTHLPTISRDLDMTVTAIMMNCSKNTGLQIFILSEKILSVSIQFIGHIFLMALDLPLPKQVFGHPWLLQGGDKMSKSKGNVIYADDMADMFGVDAVRYFVLHEMPFENDGVITWELVVERLNSELANTLGNLVNRTISMSNKYFGGVVTDKGVTAEVDDDLKNTIVEAVKKVDAKMNDLRVADAITEIFTIFKRCNKYIDETMPWALAKDPENADRLNTVLYNLVESIVVGASLLEPYMPETSEKILKQLNAEKRRVTELSNFGLYPSGNKVTDQPEILFARIDAPKMLEEIEKRFPSKVVEEEPKPEKKAKKEEKVEIPTLDAVVKEEITIDEFSRMQLQMGEIISCEEVAKSKKLLCSQVKVQGRTLQIVSGIKHYYTPEQMVGKKVVVITNLKPTKLAGVLSEGMLLCAEDFDGNLALLTAEKDMPAGAMIS